MNFLFLFIGLLLGVVIAFLFFRTKQNAGADTAVLNEKAEENISLKSKLESANEDKQRVLDETEKLRNEINTISKTLGEKEQQLKGEEEKQKAIKDEMEKLNVKFNTEFQNIANKILEEKSKTFTEQNKSNLDIILNPFKEKLISFEDKVDKAYKSESAERNSLKGEIKSLIELNKQISDEASNLAKALKGDNKMQGNWGERILESVLERSGLVKDKEYRKEVSSVNDEGARYRPDFVVFLPDEKHIIIDSKVSLVAYEKCINATKTEDKEKFLKEHIISIREHIKKLSDKGYQTLNNFNSPDFVLLFIPIESSFGIAVQADNELFDFAWDKRIVIVSPTTLLATLRTIASIWKQERQTKNHFEIAKTGGELYDKFTGFVTDMIDLGKKLEMGQGAYKDAMNKLVEGKGNVIRQTEKLKELGAKASKGLPPLLIERANENEL